MCRYERIIWSNHLTDLYDISRKVEQQLQSARELRRKASELSRDMREENARVSGIRRTAREQARLAREARETLQVEAYLQTMIEKLYTYGDSVRLQVFPVANVERPRGTQADQLNTSGSSSSAPEFETS